MKKELIEYSKTFYDFPIGPFLSAGQPTNVSVNPWLIEPSGCHF
jgi:hypothetical protein